MYIVSVEDEAARRSLGGNIEVISHGGVAERVIGTACAVQDCGSLSVTE